MRRQLIYGNYNEYHKLINGGEDRTYMEITMTIKVDKQWRRQIVCTNYNEDRMLINHRGYSLYMEITMLITRR